MVTVVLARIIARGITPFGVAPFRAAREESSRMKGVVDADIEQAIAMLTAKDEAAAPREPGAR
jgi:hypothetical protein